MHFLNRSPGAYNIVQNLYEMGNDVISSFLKDNRWIRKDCVSSTNAAVYSQNFQSGRLVSVNSVAIPGMKRKEKHPNCCVLEQPEQVCEAYAESNPLPGAQLRQTCCVGWCWMRWDKEKKNAPVKMCPSTFQEQQQWWQSSPFIWCCSLTGWFAGIVRCQRKLLSQDMKAF